MHHSPFELEPDQILFSIPISQETEESEAAAIIGQSRAMTALALGLGIQSKGYNVFIMGLPGTGRRTALLSVLKNYKPSRGILQDKAFVFDFKKPQEPRSLSFPAGQAASFKQDIHELVEDIKRIVAIHSESAEFKKKQASLFSDSEKSENRVLSEFEAAVARAGFQLVQVSEGLEQAADLAPIRNGEQTSFEELQNLVGAGLMEQAEWNALREKYYDLMDSMKKLFGEMKRTRAEMDRGVRELRREMIEPIVASQLESLKNKYRDPKQSDWLDALGEDIVSHLYFFDKTRLAEDHGLRRRKPNQLSRYGVNILIERSEGERPPIVFENRPSLANLVGTIDLDQDMPDSRAGYLKIRPGSILKADGGILVLRAEDIVSDEDAWPYLKRVLQTGKVEIQSTQGILSHPSILKPEPIDVSLKVVMIGGESSYDLLYQTDPDFQKLFKVCAEFDSTMERSTESQQKYAGFLRKIVREEGLRPLSADGTAEILGWSVRLAEHRSRLSARFSLIADLLREADWWAAQNDHAVLDATAIREALKTRAFLQRLPEDRFQTLVQSGELLIELNGAAIGKANGLAVHDRGYYAFGCPVVVSARTAPGDGGVVNIEGESGLSGEIFDKAVLILSGYLRSRYARGFPLSVTASVCFEQSYTEIDGDSATAVQLCAILSALSGVPLRQDLAITGSVNQLGAVQPVGAVSEKIEGFYSICEKIGLTGTQGVVIPRRNIANLILSNAVEEAIKNGLFHIFAVDSIDQALEVLSGRIAGQEDRNGLFPEGTVNGLVSRELKRMADLIRRYET